MDGRLANHRCPDIWSYTAENGGLVGCAVWIAIVVEEWGNQSPRRAVKAMEMSGGSRTLAKWPDGMRIGKSQDEEVPGCPRRRRRTIYEAIATVSCP